MLHKILIGFVLLSFSLMVWADDVQINPGHPESYVVKKGDTLWDISAKFLEQPWRWPEIWRVNPQIKNPHLIYPGDVVRLVYEGGKPVLTVNRGNHRTVKLEPGVRVVDEKRPIPTIPIEAIREFLTRPLVVSKDELKSRPYIVSSYDQHLIAGSGNEIYVRGLPDGTDQHRYSIYRQGPAYKSHGKVLGYEAIYVGDATVKDFGDPATALVTQSDREVLTGDRLIPQSEQDMRTDFMPHEPDRPVSGSIISAIDVLSEIGQYQVVVLDMGKNDGLQVGSVLGVYRKGAVITDRIAYSGKKDHIAGEGTNPLSNLVSDLVKTKRDVDNTALVGYLGRPNTSGEQVRLPEKYTGVVMVFRIFDKVSYALVMEAKAPMHINDTVKNL